MTIDKSNLQVLANHCAAAAGSMGYTVMRTAHSTFVKETEDFSCQLMTKEGLTFASPMTLGATWYTSLDYGGVIRMFDDYREGDIYITNDPYSGFVATHSPDVHLWKPIFSEEANCGSEPVKSITHELSWILTVTQIRAG